MNTGIPPESAPRAWQHGRGELELTAHSTQPRHVMLARFVAALYEPDDIVEVRAIWPTREHGMGAQSMWARAMALWDGAGVLWAQSKNKEGWGIYIGANPRIAARRRNAEGVARARSFYVDFDGDVTPAEALKRVYAAGLPEPTVMVASGHGVHCYWRLAEPMTDLALWTAHQKALISALGTDKAIHDPPRVMRLPGFQNTKPPAASCLLIEALPELRYPLAAFPAPSTPVRKPTVVVRAWQANKRAKRFDSVAYGRAALQMEADIVAHTAEGGRNVALYIAAARMGSLVAGGELDQAESEAALQDAARRCGLSDAEINSTLARGIRDGMKTPRARASGRSWSSDRWEGEWIAIPNEMLLPGAIGIPTAQPTVIVRDSSKSSPRRGSSRS